MEIRVSALRQKTIKTPAEFQGIGLHTGEQVVMKVLPAEPNTGIVFVKSHRNDARVKVTLENAEGAARGTNLCENGEYIHTFEHFMAALGALQLTNVEIHINSDEPPVLDGSPLPFYEKMKEAGVESQQAWAPVYKVEEPFVLEENGAILIAYPDNGYQLGYTVEYSQPAIGVQHVNVDTVENNLEENLLRSRTFCLLHEVEQQRQHNLARGGSLDCAIVVDNDKILNEEGLRVNNEFAWHKAADLFGDLRVLGGPIRGKFLGVKSGHRQNIKLLKKMVKDGSIVQENEIINKTTLELTDIKKVLPHRYPFLLVDRIIDLKVGESAVGIKNVTGNEEYFNGHFPEAPVMPGVLIVEAMAQVAGVCLLAITDNMGKIPYFMSLDQVKFRRPVYPGDQLELAIKVTKMRESTGKIEGVAKVNGKVHVEGKLSFVIK
jgi:UDP-3-O-[3-hydroxymyristoyl] N-acetylglucosamine deacetylase/3-hydroxyacyl-[acyl-carrier-protein] dehydratase